MINPAELRVDPLRVINILKTRLVEEQSKSALLEAALQECQEREQSLIAKLAELPGKQNGQLVKP